MKYFIDIKTLEELKKAYRRLAMQHHPDCGGDTETMKQINAEHDELFEVLKKQHNAQAAADSTGKIKATTETAEEFRQILDLLLRLDGLEIELCGSWLWIGGNTVIMPGVHIGSNTVIGAGSVVTKDIPDWVVAAGNPCRVIRQITDEDKKYYYKDREFDPEAWEFISSLK